MLQNKDQKGQNKIVRLCVTGVAYVTIIFYILLGIYVDKFEYVIRLYLQLHNMNIIFNRIHQNFRNTNQNF